MSDNKHYYGTLVKLNHRKDHHHGPEASAFVKTGEAFELRFETLPEVGEAFCGYLTPYGHFNTSTVKSVFVAGSDPRDKLVLPESFEAREQLEIPEVKEGDYLLSTKNSLYWLKNIEQVPVPKSMGG